MLGTMMDMPMLLSRLIDYAAENHSQTEVVGRTVGGAVERVTYAELRTRAKRLANGLRRAGLGLDSCVGSLAWNTCDHVELFYGALGIGVGLHTVNPRLSPDHLAYMINKVGDRMMFVDAATLPVAESIGGMVPCVRQWIYLDDDGTAPATRLPNLTPRSALLAGCDDDLQWPSFDERQAATICFTSGTTGMPKGVVYSHRSVTLGAMNMTMADMYGTSRAGDLETVMPIAPIFHANGWQMPFTAPMNGHKLVLPGRAFDAASVVDLAAQEGVTLAGAVPTVWMDILAHLEKEGRTLPALRTALVAGTRVPPRLFDQFERFGISVHQTWGMTEAPGVTRASPPPGSSAAPPDVRRMLVRERQGRIGFQTEFRLVDEAGAMLPHDGVATGALHIRGQGVAGRYLGEGEEQAVEWLDTGDIARIHPDGTVEIVDRAKDVIKSGGEWISTLQLESAAGSHPVVQQAAAISVPHPRWQERPLLLCTLAPGQAVSPEELRDHMLAGVTKWWLPDEILFIDAMPLTATGKIDKVALRKLYGNRSSQIAS